MLYSSRMLGKLEEEDALLGSRGGVWESGSAAVSVDADDEEEADMCVCVNVCLIAQLTADTNSLRAFVGGGSG